MARKRNEARSIISAEGTAAPVTHRRSLRAPVAPAPEESEPVVEVSEQEEVAKLAYSYWEARGGQDGSPDDDWYRAVQEVQRRRSSLTR
jgi:hypothetical protein